MLPVGEYIFGTIYVHLRRLSYITRVSIFNTRAPLIIAGGGRYEKKYRRAKEELILARNECSRLNYHQLLQEQHISELRHQVQMQQSTDLEASQVQIRHYKDQLRDREHSLTQVRAENDVLRNELEKLQSLWDQARHNCEVQSKRTAEHAAEIEKMQAKLETTLKNLKHAEEQLYKNDEIYQKQMKANEQEISKQEEQVAELQGKLEATIEMLASKEAELASKTSRAKQAQFLEKSGRMLR